MNFSKNYNKRIYLKRILGVVKSNPLFFHSISCKNDEFLFTTSNILNYYQKIFFVKDNYYLKKVN